jgi:uncharacterized protein
MAWYSYLMLTLIGVITGIINVLAGGGSLITLPILIFMGLPPSVANGTNRLGLLVQTITGVISFKKQGISNFKFALALSLVAILGAILGVQIAIDMSDELFKKVLAGVMIFVLGFVLFRQKITRQKIESSTRLKQAMLFLSFFFIGVYGGFIQAGVGFIIIATLAYFTSFDLIRINAIKIFVVSFYMLVSLGVFVYHDKIHWPAAVFLALGTGLGGWLGAKINVSRGEGVVKVVLVVAVLGFVCKLLFF